MVYLPRFNVQTHRALYRLLVAGTRSQVVSRLASTNHYRGHLFQRKTMGVSVQRAVSTQIVLETRLSQEKAARHFHFLGKVIRCLNSMNPICPWKGEETMQT